MKFYHVTKEWNGQQLESLADYLGSESEAIEEFISKWEDVDAGFASYHVQLVHLHTTKDEAVEYQKQFGGEILEIDDPEDDLEIKIDTLEFDHPVSQYPIDTDYIKKI